jgi:3-oxoadipate enol-lactonase
MPYVKVKDLQMYYEIHGDGEPLALILGRGTDISEWGSIIGWLTEKYRVLAFDNRGVGRTDKPDIAYSIEMMADDMAGLMHTLGIQQANIVGISLAACRREQSSSPPSRFPGNASFMAQAGTTIFCSIVGRIGTEMVAA